MAKPVSAIAIHWQYTCLIQSLILWPAMPYQCRTNFPLWPVHSSNLLLLISRACSCSIAWQLPQLPSIFLRWWHGITPILVTVYYAPPSNWPVPAGYFWAETLCNSLSHVHIYCQHTQQAFLAILFQLVELYPQFPPSVSYYYTIATTVLSLHLLPATVMLYACTLAQNFQPL